MNWKTNFSAAAMTTSPSEELCSIGAPFRLRILPVFLKTSTTHQVMCESSPPPLPNKATEPPTTRHGKAHQATCSARCTHEEPSTGKADISV
ncbi:MAG TPA: hypothetical protein VHM25_11820 [Polyangiaceae bacterium]|nr:hypothetical protein [Polyangiaceae bacterium]